MSGYPTFKTRGIAFTAKEKAELVDDIPCPEVDDETVVIRTRLCGLSRGTETDMYTGNFHDPAVYHFPVITGYEPVGEVVFAGKRITHVKEGDLVLGHNLVNDAYPDPYCSGWGGSVEYAVYTRKSSPMEWYGEEDCAGRRVVKVPDGLDEKDAIFGTLGGVAWHGVRRADVKRDELVAVIGLGVIGNCAAQFCQNIGARVIGLDLLPLRCDLARQCGVQHVVNAAEHDTKEVLADYSGGKGPDVIIECTGEVDNIGLCIDMASNYGRIHLQGAYLEPYPLIVQQTLFPKSLIVSSSCGATTGHVGHVFRRVLENRLVVRPMLTHLLTVEDAQKGYQMALHEPDKSVKIGFTWR